VILFLLLLKSFNVGGVSRIVSGEGETMDPIVSPISFILGFSFFSSILASFFAAFFFLSSSSIGG
jgi:hypothetical protein